MCLAVAVVWSSWPAARLGATGTVDAPMAVAEGPDPGDAALAAPAPKRTDGERTDGFTLPGSRSSGPIHIDANLLEFDARADVATFRGSVVTKQDDIVMHSAVLRVTFVPSEGIGNLDQLQTVIAEGDVRITQGNRVARGERAEFDDAARTLVLSGGAVLVEGSNEIRGERVIVYLDEERSIVEGTNSRVKAVLVPHGDGDAASGRTGEKPEGEQGKQDKQGSQGKRRKKDAATVVQDAGTAVEAAGTALGEAGTALDDGRHDEGPPE